MRYDLGRLDPVFYERTRDAQHTCRAVGAQIDPTNETVAEQERQYVVAVDALGLRRVDLDPVVVVVEPQRTRPTPHDRVEHREQRSRADALGDLYVRYDVGGHVPTVHTDFDELAVLDQVAHPRRGDGVLHAEVVSKVGHRRDAQRTSGVQ